MLSPTGKTTSGEPVMLTNGFSKFLALVSWYFTNYQLAVVMQEKHSNTPQFQRIRLPATQRGQKKHKYF